MVLACGTCCERPMALSYSSLEEVRASLIWESGIEFHYFRI
ncbi:hypothetical protein APX70_200307 [Pseudomonas syringae pv. maculicola]|uniref:Uncharacterized protein n=1 Tax=Pseudomonas syringae pv. maculicola TaxID=59511 RepID=A0A3M3A6J6_PSEYM|nr:hypothetical protein APX70_200307 [Pseudomonas syringae pv. maculicola]